MSDLKQLTSKTWIIWTVGIVGGIVLLIMVASWVLPQFFKDKLDTRLKESVQESSDGLYSIQYDNLSINILLGNAEVNDVVLKSDSTVYKRLVEQQKAPDQVASLRTDKLRLEGVSLWKLLLFKSLSIDEILIQNPDVTLAVDKKPYNKNRPKKSPYQIISKVLKSIQIDKVSLTNVDFTYSTNEGEESRQNHLQELYLDVSDFLLNKETAEDSSRILYSQQIELRMKGLTLDAGNDLYTFTLEELSLSSEDSTIKVQDVHYKPKYSKNQFGKVVGISTDRYDFKFENVTARRVDIRRFLMQQQLFAHSLTIDKGLMDVFRDRRYPDPKDHKIGKYPHQILKNANFVVRFDTVRIKGTEVIYGEQSEKTGLRGIVRFQGTQGTITNLTNDTATIADQPYCRVQAYSRFMGTGRLNVYFNFNMAAPDGAFACRGTMQDFQLKHVNPITQALAKASVESGKLEKLDFTLEANDSQSSITTQLLYNDLKVEVLRQDDQTGKLEERSFLSNLLNGLVIKDNNPSGDRPARVGEAVVQREASDSFFNLIWQSILKSITGVVTGKADGEVDKQKDDPQEDPKKKKGFLRRLLN